MRAGKTKYTPTREPTVATVDHRFLPKAVWRGLRTPEVMSTSGGKQAIFNAVVSLINPGDEVLMARPYWVTFPEVVVFAGGVPVFIDTEETHSC